MGTIELHQSPAGPARTLDLTASEIAAASARLVVRTVKRLVVDLYHWQEKHRQHHALMSLDHRMLKDMGIDRADIDAAFLPRSSGAPGWRRGGSSWT